MNKKYLTEKIVNELILEGLSKQEAIQMLYNIANKIQCNKIDYQIYTYCDYFKNAYNFYFKSCPVKDGFAIKKDVKKLYSLIKSLKFLICWQKKVYTEASKSTIDIKDIHISYKQKL